MKTLLIVFHSLTGGTRQMAEAAAEGASGEPEVGVRLLAAADAGAADVVAADGYIFATPENLAAMAGRMKDFFDRTYYPALDRDQRPALCHADLRRQRRPERRSADRPHRHRLAPASCRRPADRLHARADAGGDSGAEVDWFGGSDGLRGDRGGDGERGGGGDFLNADARCGDCCPLPSWPGVSRPSAPHRPCADGRDTPGHDGDE